MNEGRLDARFNNLPIRAVELAIQRLRDASSLSVCLGNNAFSFLEFYHILKTHGALDLFVDRRLRLGFTENEQDIETSAALCNESGRDLQLADIRDLMHNNAKQLQGMNAFCQQEADAWRKRCEKLDAAEHLRQLKAYNDTNDSVLECRITAAVFHALDNPEEIVIPTRYALKGAVGDVDGMVAGVFNKEQVIVFIEAKHNMDSSFSTAKSQCFATLRFWEDLCASDPSDLDENLASDYNTLCVAKFKEYRPMFAFGGLRFSKLDLLARIKTPSFYVVPSMDATDFTARPFACETQA